MKLTLYIFIAEDKLWNDNQTKHQNEDVDVKEQHPFQEDKVGHDSCAKLSCKKTLQKLFKISNIVCNFFFLNLFTSGNIIFFPVPLCGIIFSEIFQKISSH